MILKFAELHTPLFLNGKNFGTKLDVKKVTGLDLEYAREHQELHVAWNGQSAIIPFSNVATMVPRGEEKGEPVAPAPPPRLEQTAAQKAQGHSRAQVGSPTSHVFEGPRK